MFDAFLEFAGESLQRCGGDILEGTAEKFLAQGALIAAEICELGVDVGFGGWIRLGKVGSERPCCGATRRFVGVSGREFGLELAIPFDDGGFGDAELAADAGQAESAEAKAAKFVPGVIVVHSGGGRRPLRFPAAIAELSLCLQQRVQPLYLYMEARIDFGPFYFERLHVIGRKLLQSRNIG